MVKTDTIREQLTQLVRSHPFHPFHVNLENGDKLKIEHPENIAFSANRKGSDRLFIISSDLVHYGSIATITSLTELDRGQTRRN